MSYSHFDLRADIHWDPLKISTRTTPYCSGNSREEHVLEREIGHNFLRLEALAQTAQFKSVAEVKDALDAFFRSVENENNIYRAFAYGDAYAAGDRVLSTRLEGIDRYINTKAKKEGKTIPSLQTLADEWNVRRHEIPGKLQIIAENQRDFIAALEGMSDDNGSRNIAGHLQKARARQAAFQAHFYPMPEDFSTLDQQWAMAVAYTPRPPLRTLLGAWIKSARASLRKTEQNPTPQTFEHS